MVQIRAFRTFIWYFQQTLTIFEGQSFGNPLTGIPNTLLPLINAFIIKFVTKKKRIRAQLDELKGDQIKLLFTNKVNSLFLDNPAPRL